MPPDVDASCWQALDLRLCNICMIEIFFTFSGFILAFFAFIKPIQYFRLSMGPLTMRGLDYILIILGSVALIDVALPLLSWPFRYFYNLSYYESWYVGFYNFFRNNYILENIIFFLWIFAALATIIYLFRTAMFPAKFNKKNAEKYFNQSSLFIAEGVDANIQQLTMEIYFSIPIIFEEIYHGDEDSKKHANGMLVLFSDKKFCKKIINNPLALHKTFETILKSLDKDNTMLRPLVNRLILLLFTDSDSQLNREEPCYGLGNFQIFKRLVFGNMDFLKSSYNPLSSWYTFNENEINSSTIEKYFEIIEFSLGEYLNGRDNSPVIFCSALNVVSEIIRSNIYKLDKYSDKEVRFSSPYENLSTCSSGMARLISFIRNNQSVCSADIKSEMEGYFSGKRDDNIFSTLAGGIYKVIESFSESTHTFLNVHYLLVEIYRHPEDCTSSLLKGIQVRLDILLKQKIQENLTKLFYPAISASLIHSFGLCEPEQATLPIHQFLMRELKQKYWGIYHSNSEIARDMVSKDTEIHLELKKLTRKNPILWKRDKTLEELTLEDC